ncbi:MAG: molybdopterin-dependent oxidoreductase [Planctomycetota bacterium]
MPEITIDGRVCSYEGKKSILEVALDNQADIPHYCWHPGLSVVASCRICLAEVEAPNPRADGKLELIPKLVPTCQTPAADGMVVHTASPKSVANQKSVMEYLLINHPLDCPVCDQAGECLLQDYSYEYGHGSSRFEEDKIKQPKKDIGPHVLLYSDRCIMCSRCVRFTREVTGTGELGVFGRGSSEQIDVFPGMPLDNELSGNVIDICPVGALLDKDFLMTMRVWNLERTPSIDGLTCSGDNLSIQHNDGKVYRVKPRTNMDVNQWWTSDEIRFGWKFVHSQDRLRTPMVQADNNAGLDAAEWPDAQAAALDVLRSTVQLHGPGSLALVVSPMLSCEDAYLLGKLIVAIDPDAPLCVGPVPRKGEDRTYPGGYTTYAEKAPNARGVRRALELLTEEVHDYEGFLSSAQGARAVLLTGNYPSRWAEPALLDALQGKRVVLIDTLASDLVDSAEVLLPGATWVEKAGSFENVQNKLQHFERAIRPIEHCKAEGAIALELMRKAGLSTPNGVAVYDAEAVRREMGDAFVTDIEHPAESDVMWSDAQYVTL